MGVVGFESNKIDKLFLDGVGLQVDGILVNVFHLGNVGNFINWTTQQIIGLDMGVGIHNQGCFQEHGKGGDRVDSVIGGEQ